MFKFRSYEDWAESFYQSLDDCPKEFENLQYFYTSLDDFNSNTNSRYSNHKTICQIKMLVSIFLSIIE